MFTSGIGLENKGRRSERKERQKNQLEACLPKNSRPPAPSFHIEIIAWLREHFPVLGHRGLGRQRMHGKKGSVIKSATYGL